MKVREVIRRLIDDGWLQVSQKGSHRQFKHPVKLGKVTVPGKLSDDNLSELTKTFYGKLNWRVE
jgi:predicted RNA binding protein YcfA (HicA-like mRNA interferase family)